MSLLRRRIVEELKRRPRPLVMAHRGNAAQCPENTLAAFRRAIADGADAIETVRGMGYRLAAT